MADRDDTLVLLRESVRGTLERRWPAERALALAGDEDAVARLWVEASGQGWVPATTEPGWAAATAVVLEELGRAACPLPVLAASLAAVALGGAPAGAEVETVRAELAAGSSAVGVALGEAAGEAGAGAVAATAGTDAGFRLAGRLRFVEGAPICDRLLVAARPGPVLALVDASAVAVTLTGGLADPPLADVVLDGVTAIAAWEVGEDLLADLALLGRLGCTARALGAAQRSFELALEHARARHQFGSPIGRFQAVQHRLADCLTLLDATRLLLGRAARSHDAESATWRRDIAAVTAFAGPALRRVAREAHHVLAGVGYIEEHESPRHFRRVHADTVRYGGVVAARAELAASVLDG